MIKIIDKRLLERYFINSIYGKIAQLNEVIKIEGIINKCVCNTNCNKKYRIETDDRNKDNISIAILFENNKLEHIDVNVIIPKKELRHFIKE